MDRVAVLHLEVSGKSQPPVGQDKLGGGVGGDITSVGSDAIAESTGSTGSPAGSSSDEAGPRLVVNVRPWCDRDSLEAWINQVWGEGMCVVEAARAEDVGRGMFGAWK